jgi:hypothetical protein
MAEPKTKPTAVSIDSFLAGVADAQKREDAFRLVEMMMDITGEPPRMWGPSIVGFGQYHYVYDSGHEGDICLAGFSPRTNALVIYFNAGLEERFGPQLEKLGKFKASKSCLYIKKLADVDVAVLRAMIKANVAQLAGQSQTSAKSAPAKKGKKK